MEYTKEEFNKITHSIKDKQHYLDLVSIDTNNTLHKILELMEKHDTALLKPDKTNTNKSTPTKTTVVKTPRGTGKKSKGGKG